MEALGIPVLAITCSTARSTLAADAASRGVAAGVTAVWAKLDVGKRGECGDNHQDEQSQCTHAGESIEQMRYFGRRAKERTLRMADHDGIAKVVEGYRHFSEAVYPEHRDLFDQLRDRQDPQVLFITCADSRIDPALITHSHPGDLFICRNIGNIVPAFGEMLGGVSAVVEYAVVALHVRDIIVCGHSDCGAMKALADMESPLLQSMPIVRTWLRNAQAARSVVEAARGELAGDELVRALVEENVLLQIQHLRTHPAVAAGLAAGAIRLHGWIYSIGDGRVEAYDEPSRRFGPIEEVLGELAGTPFEKVVEHPQSAAAKAAAPHKAVATVR
jgi:carbonic anhydrase